MSGFDFEADSAYRKRRNREILVAMTPPEQASILAYEWELEKHEGCIRDAESGDWERYWKAVDARRGRSGSNER